MLGSPGEVYHDTRRNPLIAIGGWGFVLFAAAAVGYGLWALYGSGESVANFDVRPEAAVGPPRAPAGEPPCLTFGPVALDPSLNPHRAVLRAGYAPVGSQRVRYEIAMKDRDGRALWDERGALGNKDDEASFVRTTESLLEFDVESGGIYTFEVRYPEGSMDDLREASLELRGAIVRVDGRITWTLGLLAFACLVLNLVASRNQPHPYRMPDEELREAA